MSQMSDWPSRRSLTNAIRAGMGANGAAVARQPTSAAPPAASETVNGNEDFIERNYCLTPPARHTTIEARPHAGALDVPIRAPHALTRGATRVRGLRRQDVRWRHCAYSQLQLARHPGNDRGVRREDGVGRAQAHGPVRPAAREQRQTGAPDTARPREHLPGRSGPLD